MPLPGSGAIRLSQLQGEFGGSNPVSMSEYYRGGSYVINGSSTTNSIPTSGAIRMSNFYGTSAADLTPDPVNWANMTSFGNKYVFGGTSFNAPQTIQGITQAINLQIYCADVLHSDSPGGVDIWYRKNGVTEWTYLGTRYSAGVLGNISMSNGETLAFRFVTGGNGGTIANVGGNMSAWIDVINTSVSPNVQIDTFRCDASWYGNSNEPIVRE